MTFTLSRASYLRSHNKDKASHTRTLSKLEASHRIGYYRSSYFIISIHVRTYAFIILTYLENIIEIIYL